MRLAFLCVCFIFVSLALPAAVFDAQKANDLRLTEAESQKYERIKVSLGAKRAKMIVINSDVFSKESVRLDLFEGEQATLGLKRSSENAAWKGSSQAGFDRFFVKKNNERFSGNLLIRGRKYVIVPIRDGVSALYDIGSGVECGTEAKENR